MSFTIGMILLGFNIYNEVHTYWQIKELAKNGAPFIPHIREITLVSSTLLFTLVALILGMVGFIKKNKLRYLALLITLIVLMLQIIPLSMLLILI